MVEHEIPSSKASRSARELPFFAFRFSFSLPAAAGCLFFVHVRSFFLIHLPFVVRKADSAQSPDTCCQPCRFGVNNNNNGPYNNIIAQCLSSHELRENSLGHRLRRARCLERERATQVGKDGKTGAGCVKRVAGQSVRDIFEVHRMIAPQIRSPSP